MATVRQLSRFVDSEPLERSAETGPALGSEKRPRGVPAEGFRPFVTVLSFDGGLKKHSRVERVFPEREQIATKRIRTGPLVLDWDDLRFFLAVARHGSLTAAAKDLRVAQSTVGRRLASLEASLGARLLHRTPDGYVLTLAGRGVQGQAERVEAEATSVERLVGGRDMALEGVVRVTSTETLAAHVLAECFVGFQTTHPGLRVELISSLKQLSLSMREADIAVRLTRPTQHDLIVRKIGTVGFGLYASAEYLEQHGDPDFATGCSGHRLITLLDDGDSDAQAHWLAELAPRASLGLQTGSHEALLAAARASGGLACLARFRGDSEPRLQRIATPTPPPTTDIWLVVHRDSRTTPRVRATMAAIADAMKSLSPSLEPSDIDLASSAFSACNSA